MEALELAQSECGSDILVVETKRIKEETPTSKALYEVTVGIKEDIDTVMREVGLLPMESRPGYSYLKVTVQDAYVVYNLAEAVKPTIFAKDSSVTVDMVLTALKVAVAEVRNGYHDNLQIGDNLYFVFDDQGVWVRNDDEGVVLDPVSAGLVHKDDQENVVADKVLSDVIVGPEDNFSFEERLLNDFVERVESDNLETADSDITEDISDEELTELNPFGIDIEIVDPETTSEVEFKSSIIGE